MRQIRRDDSTLHLVAPKWEPVYGAVLLGLNEVAQMNDVVISGESKDWQYRASSKQRILPTF
jgi:hypothetical protein